MPFVVLCRAPASHHLGEEAEHGDVVGPRGEVRDGRGVRGRHGVRDRLTVGGHGRVVGGCAHRGDLRRRYGSRGRGRTPLDARVGGHGPRGGGGGGLLLLLLLLLRAADGGGAAAALGRVRAQVLGEVLAPGEALPAEGARVGLLPRVGEDVAAEVLVTDERLATHAALVRPRHGLRALLAAVAPTPAAAARVVGRGPARHHEGARDRDTRAPLVDGHEPPVGVRGLKEKRGRQAWKIDTGLINGKWHRVAPLNYGKTRAMNLPCHLTRSNKPDFRLR